MKKVLAWLLVLSLTAAVSIGATLAYLTDTDEDVNVMTLGKVKIDQLEYERVDDEASNEDADVQEFHDNKPLYPAVTEDGFDYTPGDTNVDWTRIGKDGYTSDIWDPTKINNELDKMVFVKNKGDYNAYVRSVIAFEANGYTVNEFKELFHLNLNDEDWTWDWLDTTVAIPGEDGTTTNYVIAVATYNEILEPGELTEISLSQIALDSIADNADIEGFGDTYQILVKSQAIQADGFEDPDTALNEGFGEITAENLPFETDNPIQGIDLKTALHNLEGDTSNVITSKVKNIVFGLNKDYANIVDNYTGTLIDVEQDVPVYAYYVPNSSGYDIYVLANDTIYAPKDSSNLFRSMTQLVSVEAGNFDVSRMENGRGLFRQCSSLTALDTTGWDLSNVTNLGYMFYQCGAISEIKGITNWDLSSNTSLEAAFYNVHSMKTLDLSGWKLGSLKTAKWAFANNNNLESINVTGWDLESLELSEWMFRVNPKLKEVVGSGDWYMPNNTSLYGMFYNNPSMTVIDATSWDLSSCTKIHDLFCACSSLETVVGLSNWNTGNITNMISTFNGCHSLKYLEDLSSWDMRKVNDIGFMFNACRSLEALEGIGEWQFENLELASYLFKGCKSLTELDVENWNMSKVTTFNSMFSSENQNKGDMQLKSLNLTKWDTSSATTMGWMFYGCGQLTELDLSGWNMPDLTTVSHMFADCFKLESIDLTGWQTSGLTSMDGMFNDCRVLKSIDMSSFDTSNVREFSQLFEACYSLEEIIGLENWDTTSGQDFSEMFSGCNSLKELNLSTFDTRNANYSYLSGGQYENWMFLRTLSGLSSLEKITFGPYFSFDGDGSAPEDYKAKMSAASNVAGWDGKWYNLETGVGYLPSEIPEETAATYVAVNPNP